MDATGPRVAKAIGNCGRRSLKQARALISHPLPNPYFAAFAERLKARGLTPAPVRVAVGNQFLRVGMAMLPHHPVLAPPTGDGSSFAQDWRKKLHGARNRVPGEATWSRLMQDVRRP